MKKWVSISLCTLVVLLSGCSVIKDYTGKSSSGAPSLSQPSSRVAIPSGAKYAFALKGQGVQIFQCSSDKNGRYWRFVAPRVDLEGLPATVKQGADHTFTASDGSVLAAKITRWGQAKSRSDIRPVVYTTTSRGKKGKLTGIRYVARENAQGGVPQSVCAPSQLGQKLEVPFSATYTFYR